MNDERFEALAKFKMCPGEHQHEPWGLDDNNEFNTAKEAEYPNGMCQAYAQVLTAIANDKGISLTASPMDHSIRPYSQVRGRKLPPIIPEYGKVVSILLNSPPALSDKKTLSRRLGDIPMGSKLLRTEAKQGGSHCIFLAFTEVVNPFRILLAVCIIHSIYCTPFQIFSSNAFL